MCEKGNPCRCCIHLMMGVTMTAAFLLCFGMYFPEDLGSFDCQHKSLSSDKSHLITLHGLMFHWL